MASVYDIENLMPPPYFKTVTKDNDNFLLTMRNNIEATLPESVFDEYLRISENIVIPTETGLFYPGIMNIM